jgi:SpoVK/Ycf46/Vps4 family AAA+-type ATPase
VQKLLNQAEEDEADMEENGASKSKLDMMLSSMGMSDMYGGARNPRLDDNSKYQMEKRLQKIDQDIQQFEEKIRTKIAASFQENGKVFRLEQLAEALKLCPFEKHCLITLVDNIILPSSPAAPTAHLSKTTVGGLIQSLCSTLEEKMMSRKYFYKGSTLVAEGILTMSGSDFMTDLTQCGVKLDRRLFDYIVGLDTEMSELVNGSHLYMPDVEADDLVLPDDTKKRIFDAVSNYDKVKDVIYDLGIDKKITYGLAQILLFYGASGTGKTMCANALAKKLGVKVLLVNFPDLGSNSSGAIIKFLFREARINRALLFFDECESLFMSRNKGGKQVNMILTELERYDGLCILATNRAYDLDEAMHRRISLAVEFRKPDRIMREQIWKALKPPQLPIEDNVDFTLLASKFELVGGTVKNAWLQSIHLMIQRGGDKVTQDDLMQAASEQVKGQISQEDFDRRVVPTVGIDGMILDNSVKEALTSVVQYSKAQR